jgi:hypothetical protein
VFRLHGLECIEVSHSLDATDREMIQAIVKVQPEVIR